MSDPLHIAALRALDDESLRAHVDQADPSEAVAMVRALHEEARRYYNTNAAESRALADRAVQIAQLSSDPACLGWASRAQAESLLYSGRMLEAEQAYTRATDASRKSGDRALLGQLLVGRIHVLSLLGRYKECESYAKEARRLLEEEGDDVYLAKLSVSLGNLHFQRDAYARALVEYDRASSLFGKQNLRDATVLGLETNRAVALTQLDRDEEALELFERLERESGQDGFDLLQAQIRMNAAYVFSQRAQFDRALEWIPLATSYFRETDHPAFLASCLINRAEVYHQLNLHGEAMELADEAEQLFDREKLRYDRALALFQSATSGLALGRVDDSLRKIKTSLRLYRTEKNPSRVALMKLLWAEGLVASRRPSHAVSKAEEALATFRKLNLVRWEAAAAALLARIQPDDSTDGLRKQATRLRQLLRRVPSELYPIQAYRLLSALGETQERAGWEAKAESTYEAALECLERLRIRIPTEDSKIAFLRDKTHLFDRLLRLEIRRTPDSGTRLFEWSERSRAQSLWDRLQSPNQSFLHASAGAPGGARGPADASADMKLETQRRHLSWLHTKLSRLELGTDVERKQARALRRTVAEAEKAWSLSLRQRGEETRQPSRARPRQAATGQAKPERKTAEHPGSTLDQVQSALQPNQGFISFHIARDFAFANVVTRRGTVWRELAPDLESRVRKLGERLDFQWGAAAMTAARYGAPALRGAHARGSVEHGDTLTLPTSLSARDRRNKTHEPPAFAALRQTTDAILQELYKLLWAPLEEIGVTRDTRWIVSPHGPIHRIPLHALRKDGEYLVDRHTISLTPSARVWLELNKQPKPRGRQRSAWIGGVPSAQLPAVEREVERVGQHLNQWRVVRDLGPTRSVFGKKAARHDLVHLAAHGSLRTDNPAFSFVQLSDGPFFVHDLEGVRFDGSTVVLTACSSGRATAPAGDEWIGMAQGFLKAGASAVIASLWPIQDGPTLELMDRFYERFRVTGDSPAALAEAMKDLQQTLPHPWHWASFAVLGGL